MEDYLQYMKTLRTQMNDVEDQAAKISVEEQMHLTTIQNLEKDLDFVKNETQRLKEETNGIMKEKGHVCSMILAHQRKITSLDSDSSTLLQTLDLIRKEKSTLSAKLKEKSAFYLKALEEMTKQLKEQQDWIMANMHRSCIHETSLAAHLEDEIGNKTGDIEGPRSNKMGNLITKLDASKADFDQMKSLKEDLVLQNRKIRRLQMKQLVKLVKDKINNCKPELKGMECEMLEEEFHALVSDKAGLTEYLQSLQLQMMKVQDLSHTVKCSCGEEYKVELGPCA